LRATLRRLTLTFNIWLGAIGFQSSAHRSAPNTMMPRDCRNSSVAGVVSKPGKRKSGVLGTVVGMP
jgi:hypothetical protein